MKASKTIPKPTNWQDFETLCKKLWGEIWNDPHIKKNGRSGQEQNGVDIVGIPFGEEGYYGIQCKGKDDYTGTKLTEKEIFSEIEKAKKFNPPLKYLYFTTTANKDVVIEEVVRKINLNHRKEGLFGVEIYNWEDIVDLINENKNTFDYYVNSINFQSQRSASVEFSDDSKELELHPEFSVNKLIYKKDIPEPSALEQMLTKSKQMNLAMNLASLRHKKEEVNKAYCSVRFKITNTGTDALEEYKLNFEIIGSFRKIAEYRKKDLLSDFYPSNITINETQSRGRIVPKNNLVGLDSYVTPQFFIYLNNEETDIEVKWQLLSKYYSSEGTLIIRTKPIVHNIKKHVPVDFLSEERVEYSDPIDYFDTENK